MQNAFQFPPPLLSHHMASLQLGPVRYHHLHNSPPRPPTDHPSHHHHLLHDQGGQLASQSRRFHMDSDKERERDNPRYDDRDSSVTEYDLEGWDVLSWDHIAHDEDDYTDSLKLNDQIMGALDMDDDIEFARLLENGKRNGTRRILKDAETGWFAFCPTELLSWILSCGARRCLDLLLSGKTGLALDNLNAPLDSGGMFPIHVAASTPPFAFVQLLIARGARTDVICKNPNSRYHLMLPIDTALFKLREKICWNPTHSVFDLIFLLYRHDFVEAFDAIKELLVHSREELIHGVIRCYVAEGLIIELAALLLADAIFSVGHFSGLSHEGYRELRLQIAKELVYVLQEDCISAIDGNGNGNWNGKGKGKGKWKAKANGNGKGKGNGHGNGNSFPCNEYGAPCSNVAEEPFSPLEKEYMSATNWHWKGNGDVIRKCINEHSLPINKYLFAKEENRNQNAMLDMLIHRKITLMSTMVLLETFGRTDLTALGFGNIPEALAKRLIGAGFDLTDDELTHLDDIFGSPIHTCMPKKLEYHRTNADPKSYLLPQGLFTTMPIMTPTNQRRSDFSFSYHGKQGLSSAVRAFHGVSQRFESGFRVNEVVEEASDAVTESEQTNSYHGQVIHALATDNEVEFADLLSLDWNKNRLGLELSSQQQLLSWIIGHGARRCFELLVLGQKSGTITNTVLDLNSPLDQSGLFPIHVAASNPPFTFVDLCIAYGARTDVICHNPESRYHLMLPIEATISLLRENSCWKRTQTVYDMLFELYQINFIVTFNAITHLLAHMTEELILRVIYRYAMEGKIVELGALLLADAFSTTACFQHLSPEKYMALRLSVSEAILSLSEAQQLSEPDGNDVDWDYINNRKMLMSSTLLLLEIFFRTDFRELKFGDEIKGLALRLSAAGFDLTTHTYLSLNKVGMPKHFEHYKTINHLPSYLKPRGLLDEVRPITFPINQQKSGIAFSLIEKRGLSSAVQAFHASQRFKARSRPMLCTPMDGPSEAVKASHGKGWKIMHSHLPKWSSFSSAIRRRLHA